MATKNKLVAAKTSIVTFIETVLINPETGRPFELLSRGNSLSPRSVYAGAGWHAPIS
jgi:hypothetical protein